MTHRFKVGDQVKIVQSGKGMSPDNENLNKTIYTVTSLDEYFSRPGVHLDKWRFDPAKECVGEDCLEMVVEAQDPADVMIDSFIALLDSGALDDHIAERWLVGMTTRSRDGYTVAYAARSKP